jgi:hypothetical protein
MAHSRLIEKYFGRRHFFLKSRAGMPISMSNEERVRIREERQREETFESRKKKIAGFNEPQA